MRPPSDPYELLSAHAAAAVLGIPRGQVVSLALRHLIRHRRSGDRLLFERGEMERTAQRFAAESAELAEV